MTFISSSCLPGKKISDIVGKLAESGFSDIELSGGTDYYPEIFDDLVHLQKQYGLNYACHSYFPPPENDFVVNLASCNNEIYEKSMVHYENCIQELPRIDCSSLSIHAGYYMELSTKDMGNKISSRIFYDIDECINRFCSAYEKLKLLAEKNGVTMYIENNVFSGANSELFDGSQSFMMIDSASILSLKDRLNFHLLLDLGHLYISCRSLSLSFENELAVLAPLSKWFHLSSNDSFSDQHKPLSSSCPITKAYFEYAHKGVNVTLETKGSIKQVMGSYKMIA
jgi:sugar phosphate isomerase/epimerase